MAEAKIYGLIAQAMKEIGAIGKDSAATNNSGKFMYKFRGIDAVYNALNPVFGKLGLCMVPEVLEQTREERKTVSGGALIYSILKVKYTMYAPDGSNVVAIVVGEGMDSGDKASNKAMSAAYKYACFQILCIPTEETIDPDADVHEVMPRNAQKSAELAPSAPPNVSTPGNVSKVAKIPENPAKNASAEIPPADPVPPVLAYLAKEREALRVAREVTKAENNALWKAQVKALTDAKLCPDKPLADFTQKEAEALIDAMYKNFPATGTELVQK